MRPVSSHIPRPDYAETGIAESERDAKRAGFIQQLPPDDIEKMKKACQVSCFFFPSKEFLSVLLCLIL